MYSCFGGLMVKGNCDLLDEIREGKMVSDQENWGKREEDLDKTDNTEKLVDYQKEEKVL